VRSEDAGPGSVARRTQLLGVAVEGACGGCAASALRLLAAGGLDALAVGVATVGACGMPPSGKRVRGAGPVSPQTGASGSADSQPVWLSASQHTGTDSFDSRPAGTGAAASNAIAPPHAKKCPRARLLVVYSIARF